MVFKVIRRGRFSHTKDNVYFKIELLYSFNLEIEV